METKVPIRGWISDGYKDVSGEVSRSLLQPNFAFLISFCFKIPLPKDSFVCPKGWEWDGDWEVSAEFNLLRDAGQSTYLEVCEPIVSFLFYFHKAVARNASNTSVEPRIQIGATTRF